MLHVDVRLRRGVLELDARLAVDASATVALVGPNGAGKTTLLRAIAGLEPIVEGEIRIDNTVVDAPATRTFVPPERRSVGVVFQDYALFPHLSVLDNVAFGLRARGVRRAAAHASARAALDAVGLPGRERDRPAMLSGGQAQRVALARALVTEPRVLLLDEPLAALDASTRHETAAGLAARLASHDGMRIVVSHDPTEAALLADHITVIEAGRIVQSGSVAELAARPASRYVADFVGVNVFRGTARRGVIDIGAAQLVAADAIDGPVVAVVHPRAVALHHQRPDGSARNTWEGRVLGVDHEDGRARLRIGGPLPIVAEITDAAASELARPGELLWVAIKATEVTVFSSPA